MKKTIIVLSILTVIIVGFVGLAYWKYNGRQESDEKFLLSSPAGKSFYKSAGSKTDYQPNFQGVIKLNNHSLVKTTDSPAVIFVSNFAKIFLEKDTELQVNIYQKGVTIRQTKGKVSYDIDEKNKNGRYFYVRTPQNIIEDKGTSYDVEIFGNIIHVDVEEGSVYSVVIDRVYDAWDPNGPEVQPISWRSISPIRVNFYPDGTWGFGTLGYDPTPGAQNRYNYDGTPINAGERGTVEIRRDSDTGRRATEVRTHEGRTPTEREIRERYRQLFDDINQRFVDGEIDDYEVGRLFDQAWRDFVADLAANAGVDPAGRDIPDVVTTCAQLRPHIPTGLAAAQKLRNSGAPGIGNIIPRGLDYYENFMHHVCDDDIIDSREQQYINEIGAWSGMGSTTAE